MFRHKNALRRTITRRGPAFTEGNLVYNKRKLWFSQRRAAEDMGVSANVMSKYLSGKLPKLDR